MSFIRIVGVCALVLSAGCEEPLPKRAMPLKSRVELAVGEVRMTGDGEDKLLATGAMLPLEATVETGRDGRALLALDSGMSVLLRERTRLRIGEEVFLESGEIWVDTPFDEKELGRIAVGETVVTASQAGFDILADKDKLEVYVARGLAVVSSPGGRSEIAAGERAAVKPDGEPGVEPVSFFDDWTGGMTGRRLRAGGGGRGSGRIYGVDRTRPGSPPEELQILSQDVRAVIREGVAHTTVDQRFFNPSPTDVEGWYWFTLPEGAAVERFAIEVADKLVEGEIVERKQARAAYEEAVENEFDPALLEWVDGRSFRARIFPIRAAGQRRVVLSYTELLPLSDNGYRYVYPMGDADETKIQEFSLKIDLGMEGSRMEISTLQDARVENGGSLVTMRHFGFRPRADFLLELRPKEPVQPLRVTRLSGGGAEADFVMIRYSPKVDWSKIGSVDGDVVVIVDTSAGGDESDRQIRFDAAEAVLRALARTDRFAVVAADLFSRAVYPQTGMAPATEENILAALEALAEIPSGGATDLGEMFKAAFDLTHKAEQPAVIYVGDGLATVGEMSADQLTERLRRSLSESRARLFTLAVGADADRALLERLARMGGGAAFRIDTGEQTVQEALRFAGLLKTPTITDLEIDAGSGLDQVFVSATNKLSRGQELVLLARTHAALPKEIKVTGRLAKGRFEETYKTDLKANATRDYIPVLWARENLKRLAGDGIEENRGAIIALGIDYAMMTPLTSFLVLESEAAYEAQGIKRRQRSKQWSFLEGDENRDALTAASGISTIPLLPMGCSSESSESLDLLDENNRFTKYMLETPSVQQAEEPKWIEKSERDEEQGGAGRRHKGEEGQMGKRDSGRSGGRMGIRGPAGNEDPHMARELAKEMAKGAWILNRLSSAQSPTSPFGQDTALGVDPENALGALMGNQTGNSFGYGGVGVVGTGRGGGGAGERSAGLTLGEMRSVIAASEDEEPRRAPGEAQTSSRLPKICSDASRRSLPERRQLWMRRLQLAENQYQAAVVFTDAEASCELLRWRDRRALLDLIEPFAKSPDDVLDMLTSFREYPAEQSYLRRKILAHALDPDLVMGLYASKIDWSAAARGLAVLKDPKARVKKLRAFLEKFPEDEVGRMMLLAALLDADMVDDARATATKLRADGLAGTLVLRVLCDLQAESGADEQARRTCSEIVEFGGRDPAARSELGNLFLRHGWYEAAYNQYSTLAAMAPDDPVSMLRMAIAAAGAGRADEALRIEHSVATGDGNPGRNDPRQWARYHSAARLSRLMLAARSQGDSVLAKKLERELKRTQVFQAKSKLTVLLWTDLGSDLDLVRGSEDGPCPSQLKIVSLETGMVALSTADVSCSDPKIVRSSTQALRRPVAFTVLNVSWDGRSFAVETRDGSLKPRESEVKI